MATNIDIQAIAASAYATMQLLNQAAENLVGLDAVYCRLLPYDNGEDVIVQEYTLHQYECPQQLRVVSSNSAYNVANFLLTPFGIQSAELLEININMATWKSIYGENTMPQKGDFVLVEMFHRAYEVVSSTVIHTIGLIPTYYKCVLGDWHHAASRKETEDFHISIDELTNSQDRLFGEQISKEVADAVVEVETAYNTTTYVDPLKEFDLDSIVVSDIRGKHGNIISNAYYDFNIALKNVIYRINATYDRDVKENHWIYSCWFKNNSEETIQSSSLKISGIYLKEKDYWWFNISSGLQLNDGDEVTIYRGGTIKLVGIIESKECESGWTIKIPASDCLKANKKVQNWWTSGIWKIQMYNYYNLLTCYNGEDIALKFNIDGNKIIVKTNNFEKKIDLVDSAISVSYNDWHYIAFDMTPSNIRIILVKTIENTDGKHSDKVLYDNTTNINILNFNITSASIENSLKDICMTNIRLYENEYPLEDNYLLDMYSEVTRNASKLILVDTPRPANDMSFITPVR